MIKPTGAANYAVSRQGTLLYVPGGVGAQTTLRSLVWVDRKGHEEPIKAPLRDYGPPRVSPDGTRLAMQILEPDNSDIWIWDLARETLRRLTFAPGTDGLPLWTPDGRRIIFNVGPITFGRAEPVQPGRRRHRYGRPADDECEPAVRRRPSRRTGHASLPSKPCPGRCRAGGARNRIGSCCFP